MPSGVLPNISGHFKAVKSVHDKTIKPVCKLFVT
jgi:hypothetical protein